MKKQTKILRILITVAALSIPQHPQAGEIPDCDDTESIPCHTAKPYIGLPCVNGGQQLLGETAGDVNVDMCDTPGPDDTPTGFCSFAGTKVCHWYAILYDCSGVEHITPNVENIATYTCN